MVRTLKRKVVVAVVAACALVALMAAPASATVSNGSIDAGTIEVGDFEFEIGGEPDNPPPCDMPAGPDPATVSVDFTNVTSTTADTELTGINAAAAPFEITSGTPTGWFAMELAVTDLFMNGNDGELHSNGTITQDAEFSATISELNVSGEDCVIEDPVCTLVVVPFSGLSGSWSGDPSDMTGTGVSVTGLGGSASISQVGCPSSIASQLAGGAVLAGMELTFPV